MIKNILVALDGSENANRALNYALDLAEKFEAKLTLIHVYSSVVPIAQPMDALSVPSPETSIVIAEKIVEANRQRGAQILAEAEQTAKQRGITVEKTLLEGDAVNQIVVAAKEGGVDLVVVGHKGMSKLREFLLGSVSEGVSHKAPCPVLIVK